MPADGISLPPTKGGPRHVPLGPARGLGYINQPIDGRGHECLWGIATKWRRPLLRQLVVVNQKRYAQFETCRS